MIARVLVATIATALLTSCVSGTAAMRRWNPALATADAERDIAYSRIRFAYVGGWVPVAPGLSYSDATYTVIERYGRLWVGPQSCIQDEHSDERREYASRYNQRMWRHVTGKSPKSSNQAMQRTADPPDA